MSARLSWRLRLLRSMSSVASDPLIDSSPDVHSLRVRLPLRRRLAGEIDDALHAVQQHLQLAHHQATQRRQQREVVAAVAQQLTDGQQVAQALTRRKRIKRTIADEPS